MNASASRQGEDELAYTTVLSLLQVMEQKGLVDHQRIGKAYVYAPRVERQSTFRRLAGSFLEKVFDGAVDEYLVHALDEAIVRRRAGRTRSDARAARERTSKRGRKGGRK